jgi:hypothetical protein
MKSKDLTLLTLFGLDFTLYLTQIFDHIVGTRSTQFHIFLLKVSSSSFHTPFSAMLNGSLVWTRHLGQPIVSATATRCNWSHQHDLVFPQHKHFLWCIPMRKIYYIQTRSTWRSDTIRHKQPIHVTKNDIQPMYLVSKWGGAPTCWNHIPSRFTVITLTSEVMWLISEYNRSSTLGMLPRLHHMYIHTLRN